MNKGALIAVVIAILIAVGAGVFVLSTRTSKPSGSANIQTGSSTNTTPSANTTPKKSLKELIGAGQVQECKFTDPDTLAEGLVRTSGNKSSAEFSAVTEGQTVLSHMISDGENVYVWMEGQSQGMKMSQASLDDFSDAPEEQKGAVDLNRQLEYKCGVWAVDNSVFEVPKDVKFQDLSTLMQESQTAAQVTPGANDGDTYEECEACQNLTGSAKDQCLQTLGC
jgi:hypothetical protein